MDRKEAIRKYKETPIPAGVFCVRTATRAYVGSSVNVPAMLNRIRFQLEHGSHPNKALQQEWNGAPAAISFETLDTLEPAKEPGYDPADDLETLEAMWRENIARRGVKVEPIDQRRRSKL